MELYKVTVSYASEYDRQEWQSRRDAHFARANQRLPFTEPPPERKTKIVHVAVEGSFGGAAIGTASDLACERFIVSRDRWDTYMPFVERIEHVGSVAVAVAVAEAVAGARVATASDDGTGDGTGDGSANA